jgi:hypothetical protein
LADGNADIPSGYVQITKNDEGVRTFVKNWFTKIGMKFNEGGTLVYNPEFKGEQYTFDAEYFIEF